MFGARSAPYENGDDGTPLPLAASARQALSFGYFPLGQQRKVTRARSARNASKAGLEIRS
jgi:hypothetical protein